MKRGLALPPRLLGFGDDAARPAPALARAVEEFLEAQRRALRLPRLGLGLLQFSADGAHRAHVLGEPEHVIYSVLLAPAHQLLAAKARVGAGAGLRLAHDETLVRQRARRH